MVSDTLGNTKPSAGFKLDQKTELLASGGEFWAVLDPGGIYLGQHERHRELQRERERERTPTPTRLKSLGGGVGGREVLFFFLGGGGTLH